LLRCHSKSPSDTDTFEDEDGEEYEPSKFGGFGDYFRRKKIKLQNLDAELRSSSGENPPIFRGIVAHVNGYTTPSLNDIHRLIVSHGGGFLQYLDGKTMVTHIIASSLTPKKKVEFKKYRIVKPAWVVESVKAARLLPWDDFRVVDEGSGQKVLGFDNGRVVTQTNSTQRGYREQTDSSWYTSQLKNAAERHDQPNPTEGGDALMPDSSLSPATRPTPSTGFGSTEDATTQQQQMIPVSPSLALDADGAHSKTATNSKQGQQSFESQNSLDGELSKLPLPSPEDHSNTIAGPGRIIDGMAKTELSFVQNAINEHPEPPGEIPAPGKGKSPEKERTSARAHMTAEEHNAELLSDPRMWKSSGVNPDFLKQYYEESRLHHLSTWKAELKAQLQALTLEKTSSQKSRQKRPPGSRRYILHVDFDSFFAAVSLRKHPEYIDKPVVVAHGSGPGSEIASCNYPARKYGVKNGMWMKGALQLCPDLKVLPYDFQAYEEASRNFYDAILATDGIVQSVSIDEALVDVSAQCISAGGSDGRAVQEHSIHREQAKADELAGRLRDQIKEKTGCAVSVGIGGNILLAKVALRKAKPAGQYQIKPEEVLNFLAPLAVQDLPGVAYSIGGKLEEIGVKLVKDIRDLTKERIINTLGPKTGERLWDYSRGIDRAEVGEQVVRKSVSAEVNWGIRFVTQEQAEEFVQSLCDELNRRLLEAGVKGRQLTMKIMKRAADAPRDPPKHMGHGKCDTFNKSVVLGVTTNAKDILGKEAISILRGFGFSPGELRGLGVQMTKLEPLKATQTTLLDSGQRRLQFKIPSSETKSVADRVDPIEDIDSPKKGSKNVATTIIPTIGHPSEIKDEKPLNVLGTQFVMPTQVDPEVLAELPEDIRSKFAPKPKGAPLPQPSRKLPFESKSRSHSPSITSELPSQSQLDPEALEALPDDVRAEVLAFYSNPANSHRDGHRALPHSPRKPRAAPTPSTKKLTTPTKKKAVIFSRTKDSSKPTNAFNSTLTQSNFVSSLSNSKISKLNDPSTSDEEISADFLAALPPDIRREVLENQKRSRLKKKGGLDLGSRPKKQSRPPETDAPVAQRRLRLPPRPERPTFTAKKLSSPAELKDAMSSWYEEFKDEGPFAEDTEALVKYLRRVVLEERDLDKAVSVVKWVGWLIGQSEHDREGDGDDGQNEDAWRRALTVVQDGVQSAIKERGLGMVDF
jgi:DNA repair protein REV1